MSALHPKAALRGLLDFKFRTLVTPYLVGLLFALSVVEAAAYYVLWTVDLFNTNAGLGALYMLILGPVVAFLMVLWYRMTYELLVVLFRIWTMRHERLELLRIVDRQS